MPESVEVEYPELKPSDAPDALIDLDDDEDVVPSSADSGITSYTQYELSKLDQESMINALPFLCQYSDSLISLFSSGDARELGRLHRDLQEPTSKASRRLNTLLEGFMLNRKHYGDDTPVAIDIAVRALVGLRQADEIPDGPWRPDAALYMANLAHYVSTIYSSNENSENARETITSMFHSFPASFAPVFDADVKLQERYSANSAASDTFALMLDIRTQYLLQGLSQKRNHPAFDPDEALRAVFYVDHDRLRGPDYMEELSTLPPDIKTIFAKRITAIRCHFSNDISNPVDFHGLRQAFPYTGFLVSLARWAQLMTKRHKDVITEHGGISQIQSLLQDEFERRQSGEEDKLGAGSPSNLAETQGRVLRDREGTKRSESEQAPNGSDSAPNSPSKAKASKAMRKKSQPRKSLEWRAKQQQTYNEMLAASMARKVANAAKEAQEALPPAEEAPIYDVEFGGDNEPSLPSPSRTQSGPPMSQQGLAILATLKTHATQSNKENMDSPQRGKMAFIDRQRGAERITFDSQDETLVVQGRTSKKRKASETDDDEEEEEEEEDYFEVDPRHIHPVPRRQISTQPQSTKADSRRLKAPKTKHTSRGSPSKRVRSEYATRKFVNREDDDDEEGEDDDNLAASSKLQMEEATRNRHHSASSDASRHRLPLHERHDAPPSSAVPEGGPSTGTHVADIMRVLKKNKAGRLVKARLPQQRLRWTDDEVTRLVELIERHGVSWSTLLELDRQDENPKLQDRDQVALKDKARNIKMDFLKYVFPTALDVRCVLTMQ